MIHAISHAATLILLTTLFFLSGYLLERWASHVRVATESSVLLRIAAGLVFWIAVAFALAVTGQLQPIAVSLLAALIVCGSVISVRRAYSDAADPPDVIWATLPLTVWGALLFAPAVVVGSSFVNQLHPAVIIDDAVYHLTLPRLYVEAGGFRDVPLSLFAHWPQNIELLYAVAMILDDYVGAKLVSWLFLVLLVSLLIRFGTSRGSGLVASVAACLLLANQTVLFEANLAYVDLAIAFWGLLAFAFVCQHLDRPSLQALVAAGVCAGIAAGSKLSGAFIGMALLTVLIVELVSERAPWPALVHAATVLTGVTLLLALPWYVRSIIHTGSPAFPLGFGTVPATPEHWQWSSQLSDQFWSWQIDRVGMGRGWTDYLLLPYRVIVDARAGDFVTFDGRFNRIWIVMFPLAALVAFFDRTVRRGVVFSVAFFVLWAIGSQQLRLLIPALPPAAFACALALVRSLRWLLNWRSFTPTTTGGAARFSIPWAIAVLLAVSFQSGLLWVARYSMQHSVSLAKRLVVGPPVTLAETIDPVFDFLNQELPAGSRVMMLNFSDTFFLKHEFLVDSTPHASQIADLLSREPSVDGIALTLDRLGVTHLVWHNRNWGIRYPDALGMFLKDGRRVKPVYWTHDGSFTVFAIGESH